MPEEFSVDYYSISPIRKIDEINRDFKGDSSKPKIVLRDFFEQEKEEAFLESRIKMAESDSVCLVVNLEDSSILLVLQGVVLHTAKIQSFKSCNLYSRIHEDAYLNYFASPFTIKETYSTIPREEFVIKQAPSDTSQEAPAVIPDTTYKEVVCFTLYTNRDLQIDIRQTDNHEQKEYKSYRKYKIKEEITNMLYPLIEFKVPPYIPWIRIDLAEKDAKSIYKALPVHASVSLKL